MMELPDTIKVSVTDSDIINGQPHLWGRDPVSLAMTRALGLQPRQVNADSYVTDVYADIKTGRLLGCYATPANVRGFLEMFNGPMSERACCRPFTFTAYRFPVSAYKVIGGIDGQAVPCDLKGTILEDSTHE